MSPQSALFASLALAASSTSALGAPVSQEGNFIEHPFRAAPNTHSNKANKHIFVTRDFNGSAASAMHELGRAFNSKNRYFPLVVIVCLFLGTFHLFQIAYASALNHRSFSTGFVVLLCIVKAVIKFFKKERHHACNALPQTSFSGDVSDGNSLTRFVKRNICRQSSRPLTAPLSPGGKSFLTSIPEKSYSRSSSTISLGTKDNEAMGEVLPVYEQKPVSTGGGLLPPLVLSPTLAFSPNMDPSVPYKPSLQRAVISRTLQRPPKLARVSPPQSLSALPPREASMPPPPPQLPLKLQEPSTNQQQQSALGVGRGRMSSPTGRRSPYERVTTA